MFIIVYVNFSVFKIDAVRPTSPKDRINLFLCGRAVAFKNELCKSNKSFQPAAVSDDVIRGAYFVKDPGAESVAKIISDLVKVGKIFDKGVERPIKYSDFLLLLWNTTQMEFYSMVLTDRGIPYTMWGKRPQKNSLVLKRFIALAV